MPATPDEALRTSLMGIFEKRRFRNFLQYLAGYEEDKPDTFKGKGSRANGIVYCGCCIGRNTTYLEVATVLLGMVVSELLSVTTVVVAE